MGTGFVVKCRNCGRVVTQCRCACKDKIVRWVPDCSVCQGKPIISEEITSKD